MIYRLYYIDDQGVRRVRSVDDIHDYNVWLVSGNWGTAIAVVEESEQQPADAGDYQEAST